MEIYLYLALTSFAAFYLKGITGTGTTTMIVALGSFYLEPKITIILASFINIFGGLAMLNIDPVQLAKKYWIPITIMMVVGSVFGAISLKVIDPKIFKTVLGTAFLLASLSFFLAKKTSNEKNNISPQLASPLDYIFGWIAGFCGGFVGVNAPPLVYHYGKALNKNQLRRLLIIIFIPSAIAQTLTFAYTGLLTKQIALYGLTMLPFMAVGIHFGNKVHFKISEKWFRRILGIFLVFVSLKLLLT